MAARIADAVSGLDLDGALSSLTRAAVEMLPGVDEATIGIRHEDGSLWSYAFTSEYLEELDLWQYDHDEGPCYDGVTNNAFTLCGDLRNDPRYPSYGPHAAAAGIRSQAGLRLFESRRTIGGLNLYSRSIGALSDVAFLAELFSEHARGAITTRRRSTASATPSRPSRSSGRPWASSWSASTCPRTARSPS